jgi:hypothetical protein
VENDIIFDIFLNYESIAAAEKAAAAAATSA